jgi:hypothetical protein
MVFAEPGDFKCARDELARALVSFVVCKEWEHVDTS